MKIEKLEHQLKKWFNEHKAYGLDESSLWQSIEEELESEKEESKPIPFFYYVLGSFLFISMILATVWCTQRSGSVSEDIAKIELVGEKYSARMKQAPKGETGFSAHIETGLSKPNRKDAGEESISQKSISVVRNKKAISKKATDLSVNSSSSDLPKEETNFTLNEEAKLNIVSSVILKSKNVDSTLNNLPISTLQFFTLPTLKLNLPSVDSPKAKVGKQTATWLLGLEAGPVYSTLGFNSKNSTPVSLRKQTETPKLGWEIAFNAIHTEPLGLTWGIGLSYRRSWTRFNYHKESTEEILLENSLLEILIDQNTMDTIGMRYGQASMEVSNKREIQHYNETSTLGIPIHFGYMKQRRGITFGIMGNLRYDYLVQQRGLFLDANDGITDLQEVNYFRKSVISANLRPLLIVDFKQGFGLSLAASVGFALTNKVTGAAGYAQRPVEFGLSTGFIKRIN